MLWNPPHALAVLPILVTVACGSPVRLDECQPSDSSLDCTSCCERNGFGDRPSAFTSATGRCTCYEERSNSAPGDEGSANPPPLSSGDQRCWDFFNGVLQAECADVEIGPGINTCGANFCSDAGIGANRVDAECDAFLSCWDAYASCMDSCEEDLTAIDRCNTQLYGCVEAGG